MRTRTSKIARLPREVRDELNRRLDNGEDGAALLAWLNGRPGTLKVMQDHFGGALISKHNLSDWRQGGFMDWQRQQEALALAGCLLEEAEDCEKLAKDGRLTDRMAELLAVALGNLLRDAARLPAGPERTRAVLGAAQELIRLRQTDREWERAGREQKDWQRKQQEQEKGDREKAEKERKWRDLAPLKMMDRRHLLTTVYGGGEAAERRAWWETGVEFGLPESEWDPPPKPRPEPVATEEGSGQKSAVSGGSPEADHPTYENQEVQAGPGHAGATATVEPSRMQSNPVEPSAT